MNALRATFESFASELAPLCVHISVRDDENGPYIFALGLKETHTLQMRRVAALYQVELWHGRTAEVEKVVGKPTFPNPTDAFNAAKAWLMKDAI